MRKRLLILPFFRLDWEDAEDQFMTDSIREINKRPGVAAEYVARGVPPIESNESYVWLDKLYGRPERVVGKERHVYLYGPGVPED